MCIDVNSNIYVVSTGSSIQKISTITSNVSTLTTSVSGNYDVAVDSTGSFIYTNAGFTTITRINTTSGSSTLLYTASGQFGSIAGLVVDSMNSNIYFTDINNSVIGKYNFSSNTATLFAGTTNSTSNVFNDGSLTTGKLYRPFTLRFGKSGLLYVLQEPGGMIRLINPFTSNISTIRSEFDNQVNAYNSLVITPSEGSLFTCRTAAPTGIFQMALGSSMTTLAGSGTAGFTNAQGVSAQFNTPTGLTFISSNLYVADTSNVIRLITTTGNVSSLLVSTVITQNNPQSLSLYSNSLYTVICSSSSSTLVQLPLGYPSTTFTFSNITSNTQIQNTTGRTVTIAVTGGTVTNSNLPSIANISDIKTLFNTTGTTYTLL